MKNNLSSQINTLFVVFSKLEFYYVSIAIPTKYSYDALSSTYKFIKEVFWWREGRGDTWGEGCSLWLCAACFH